MFFGVQLTETEQKLLGVLFTGAVLIMGWLLNRSGRKADQQTQSKNTIEGPETQGLTMRDLMVETFRKSGAAEERAGEASTSAASASAMCGDLGQKIERNHGEVKTEIVRLDLRIDGAVKDATQALQLARAAAGDRSSDETLRKSAAMTPASTGTEG